MQRYYYRVQRLNEPLNEYIREIKMYSRVLCATSVEKEVVDNILSGLSPGDRSCLNLRSSLITLMTWTHSALGTRLHCSWTLCVAILARGVFHPVLQMLRRLLRKIFSLALRVGSHVIIAVRPIMSSEIFPYVTGPVALWKSLKILIFHFLLDNYRRSPRAIGDILLKILEFLCCCRLSWSMLRSRLIRN